MLHVMVQRAETLPGRLGELWMPLWLLGEPGAVLVDEHLFFLTLPSLWVGTRLMQQVNLEHLQTWDRCGRSPLKLPVLLQPHPGLMWPWSMFAHLPKAPLNRCFP